MHLYVHMYTHIHYSPVILKIFKKRSLLLPFGLFLDTLAQLRLLDLLWCNRPIHWEYYVSFLFLSGRPPGQGNRSPHNTAEASEGINLLDLTQEHLRKRIWINFLPFLPTWPIWKSFNNIYVICITEFQGDGNVGEIWYNPPISKMVNNNWLLTL